MRTGLIGLGAMGFGMALNLNISDRWRMVMAKRISPPCIV